MSQLKSSDARAVAIVGMSCRLPGADSCAELWANLSSGHDAVSDIPAARSGLRDATSTVPATPGRSISQQGGYLRGLSAFDPAAFGISRREALSMDPQQRILLELAWLALEDAGIPSTTLHGSRTGVYVGVCYGDFEDLQLQHAPDFDVYRMIGGARNMLCGRLSHWLGLAGPSLTVDAACASSLLAVHLAVQSLRSGESELALVAGCNLILHPMFSIGFSQARLLSPDSRCKAFAQAADGFVRSEGAGLVVLKPLARAQQDGDRIYAVLRGSAVGNDGAGDQPLMTPSVRGQEQLLRAAYADAQIDPASVSYIEAHGTGTPTGDYVEALALGAVLAPGRQTPCRLGSVKSNLGHTEGAAGIVSFIKAALCIHHRTLVPSLHCQTPRKEIPWAQLQLEVQQCTEAWHDPHGPLIAGVSSFGLNGTNTHVVLGEAPTASNSAAAPTGEAAQLLLLSAQSPEALLALSRAYKESLRAGVSPAAPALADLCAAAALRRAHLPHRLAVVCTDERDGHDKLAVLASDRDAPLSTRGQVPVRPLPLVFVYSGQGSQWAGMARHLYAVSATFRSALQRCDTALAPYREHSLLELLLSAPPRELVGIDVIQPALFAIQVALTAVLRELGLIPDLVIGHSMGEVAAAHAAGALELASAARIIGQRSRLLRQKSGQGAMAVLDLSLADTEQLLVHHNLTTRVAVAVSSSAQSTVVAGDPEAVSGLVETLTQREIFARPIQVDVASHSPQMDALREPLLRALQGLVALPLTTAMISTVTTQKLHGPELTAEYWVNNLRQPVLLAPVLDKILAASECSLVEISPHPLLLTAIQQCQKTRGRELPALATLRKSEDDWAALLATVGALHTRGHHVDFTRLFPHGARNVLLPTYPFSRETCQDDSAPTALLTTQTVLGGTGDPCLGVPLDLAASAGSRVWLLDASHEVLRSFTDHRVLGEVVVPGAATVAWALTAAQRAGLGACVAEQAEFRQVLFLSATSAQKIQAVLTPETNGESSLRVYAAAAGNMPSSWQLHAQVMLRPARLAKVASYLDLHSLQAEPRRAIDGEAIYRALAGIGLDYGKEYRWLAGAELGNHDALARLGEQRVDSLAQTSHWAHGVTPALLDACLQLVMVAAGSEAAAGALSLPGSGYLPVRIEAVRQRGEINKGRFLYAQLRDPEPAERPADGHLTGDAWMLSERGEVLLEIVGITAQPLRQRPSLPWHLAWRPQPLVTPESGSGSQQVRSARADYHLIIGTAGDAAEALTAKLHHDGQRCIQVRPGPKFIRHSAALFELVPTETTHWQELALHLPHEPGAACAAVVYLLGLDSSDTTDPDLQQYTAALDLGCLGLLGWLQAHCLRDAAHRLDGGLLIVTRAARAVTAGAATRPLQALLWGFAGVVTSEFPELGARRIDLNHDVINPQEVATLLYRELAARDPVVAWRAAQRYVARLVHALPAGPPIVKAAAVRSDATYVVTGGLSGLGLVVAQWLVDQGARRLLLIGRSAPAAASAAIITTLQQRGVVVLVGLVDVTDATALATTLAQAEDAAYPLRGIIHSAAVLEDSIVLMLPPEQLRRVLAPKVLGALHLQRLTAHAALDFFVLFSSAAAVLGNPGQSSYCAANSFLDAFAESRVAQELPGLSIAWGPWAGTGLAARGAHVDHLAARGLPSLSVEKGIGTFAELLRSGCTTACPIVANFEVERWLSVTAGASAALLHEVRNTEVAQPAAVPASTSIVPAPSSTVRLRDAIVALPAAERPPRVLAALRELVAKILRAPPSQHHQLAAELPLIRLGLDSLMAIELRSRIEAELGVSMPLSLIMQHGTLVAITARVVQELATAEVTPPALWDEGEL